MEEMTLLGDIEDLPNELQQGGAQADRRALFREA